MLSAQCGFDCAAAPGRDEDLSQSICARCIWRVGMEVAAVRQALRACVFDSAVLCQQGCISGVESEEGGISWQAINTAEMGVG